MSTRQQVDVPWPPDRDEGPRGSRRPPTTSVVDSYVRNIIRIEGTTRTVDVVPVEGRSVHPTPPVRLPTPATDEPGPLHVIGGSHPSSQPSTPEQDRRATRDLEKRLDKRGWAWDPAVIFPPGREWVQTAAAVRGVPLDDVLDLARRRGQEAVHTWFEGRLVVTPTGLGPDLLTPAAVRAEARPATFGCPIRFGHVDKVCVRAGGPFTSGSMRAALVWEHHRALLVGALGCAICAGGNITSEGRPYGTTEMITPSRRGGWAWGAPRDDLVDPTQSPGRHGRTGTSNRSQIDER